MWTPLAARQARPALELAALVTQQTCRLQAADIHAVGIAKNTVDMQVVGRRRTPITRRVKQAGLECPAHALDVQTEAKFAAVKVEPQNAVETGRGEIQPPFMDGDLVCVHQKGVAIGCEQPEIGAVNEQLVAGGHKHLRAVEGYTPQATVPAPPLPVDIRGIPVDNLLEGIALCIDQVNTAVALPLLTSTHHRGGDQYCQSSTPATLIDDLAQMSLTRCVREGVRRSRSGAGYT